MTFADTLFCLFSLLPAPQSDLQLPARTPTPGVTADVPRPDSEVERFRRDLADLASAPSRSERKLQEMALAYPAIEDLIVEVARGARAKEMGDLMQVAHRLGKAKVAGELRFQLLSRPLGQATRSVVETMTYLMGPERDPNQELDEKKALQDCIRGRVASARRPAAEVFATMASVDDLPFAMALCSDQSLDLQLRGVDLLRAIPDERSRARLVQLLSKEPALAGATCEALIALREAAVPDLLRLLGQPAIDRGYCYAAFALGEIGESTGQRHLTQPMIVTLTDRLADRDVLTRSLAAVALADLSFYSSPGSAVNLPDAAIGDALLDLVDSKTFIPNVGLLRGPAEQRLVRMTGRVVTGGEALAWRDWWQASRPGFVGIRAAVTVNAGNARNCVVTLRTETQVIRLLAEGLADSAPLAGAQETLLTATQMLAMVQALEAAGFGDVEVMRHGTALPLQRSLEVQVEGARSLVAMPAIAHHAFDSLVLRIEAEVESELWQLYRHPMDEPDRAAFWRTERRWLDAHGNATERGQRFSRRVLQNWPVLSAKLRGRALAHLFARSDRAQLLDETDGDRILAIVRAAPELREIEMRLLELAAPVPGDRVWRECVDVAARAPGGGRAAVRSVFAVLGPDAVLIALADERPVVRRVAIDEATIARDLRAGPRLVELLKNEAEDEEVRRAAAYAAGQLRLVEAQRPLVDLIAAEATPPVVRRECLHALGRVGGDLAFPVLDRALRAPVSEDREAALRGLGELRDPRSAHTLAELAVIAHGKDLGTLSRFYLGRMGASLAVPALRHQVKVVQDPAIRDQLVLLLGGYQDPQVIPDLMQLLRTPEWKNDAGVALMGTTGFALMEEDDRWAAMDAWWRKNRALPQWRWLLDALAAKNEATTLRAEHFAAGGSRESVPELARLLGELGEPRLFVLASAVLRDVSKEDFGVVTMQTPAEARAGIAARYRLLFESQKAAAGR